MFSAQHQTEETARSVLIIRIYKIHHYAIQTHAFFLNLRNKNAVIPFNESSSDQKLYISLDELSL